MNLKYKISQGNSYYFNILNIDFYKYSFNMLPIGWTIDYTGRISKKNINFIWWNPNWGCYIISGLRGIKIK